MKIAEDSDEEDRECCSLCLGTGIGQHGDPDTSTCHMCKGHGYIVEKEEPDPDRAYDEWRDRRDRRREDR